jgi:hypothetical protein
MHNINLTVKIERAISELRRGGKVVISDNNTGISVLLMSSELVQLDTVDTFRKLRFHDLILFYLLIVLRQLVLNLITNHVQF